MKARENPFRSQRIEALSFRAWDFTLDEVLALLDSFGGHGAIVGPHGSGKTTLLEALKPLCEARGYPTYLVRLAKPSWPSFLPPQGVRCALLLDEADALGKRAKPFLEAIAAECDLLVASTNGQGLLPTLVELRTSPDLLMNLVCELLEGQDLGEVAPGLPGLWKKHRGDLRASFRELYDRFALRNEGTEAGSGERAAD